MFLVLLVSFTIIYSSIAYFVMSLSHPASQEFIGFGVYDTKGDLSNYYQNNLAPNVTIGNTLNWRLTIENRMGTTQMTEVVVKLGNLTTIIPTKTGPSTLAPIDQYVKTTANNENNTINFDWRILNVTRQGKLTYLNLELNGKQLPTIVGAPSGQGFRFIFELWTLGDNGAFQYGYPNGNTRVGEYLMLWFNSLPG